MSDIPVVPITTEPEPNTLALLDMDPASMTRLQQRQCCEIAARWLGLVQGHTEVVSEAVGRARYYAIKAVQMLNRPEEKGVINE